MDLESNYKQAAKLYKDGHFEACVTKCSSIFKIAFKEVYQTYLSSLTNKK